MSFFTRQYLTGHRVPRDALANYTTADWDHVRKEFDRLLKGPMAAIVETSRRRMIELRVARAENTDQA